MNSEEEKLDVIKESSNESIQNPRVKLDYASKLKSKVIPDIIDEIGNLDFGEETQEEVKTGEELLAMMDSLQ